MWQRLRVYGIPQDSQGRMFCDLAFMKIKRLETLENKIFTSCRGRHQAVRWEEALWSVEIRTLVTLSQVWKPFPAARERVLPLDSAWNSPAEFIQVNIWQCLSHRECLDWKNVKIIVLGRWELHVLISLGPTSLSPAKLPLWELESQVCSHMDYLCLSLGGRWECFRELLPGRKLERNTKCLTPLCPGQAAEPVQGQQFSAALGQESSSSREELWEKHL